MSFFGFDTTLPRDRERSGDSRGFFEHPDPFDEVARAKAQGLHDDEDAIDFEDTYDGLGDQLDDEQDAFNEDTFGADAATVGKDFDFYGNTAQVSDVITEEQIRYNLQHHKTTTTTAPPATASTTATTTAPPTSATATTAATTTTTTTTTTSTATTQKPKKTGYEKYQDPGYIPEISAKSSVWKTDTKPAATSAQPAAPAKKMMSLEEVEAQMRAQNKRPTPAQPAVSVPPIAELPPSVPRPQQMPPLPDGYSQLPPELLHLEQQAQFAKGVPPSQMLQRHQQAPPEPYPPHAGIPPQAPLQMMQNPSRPQQMPPQQRHAGPPRMPRPPQQPLIGPNGTPLITNPQQLMNLTEEQRMALLAEDAKRAKRNHKIFLLSKGNGLMTPQDKNLITRIQLQQLVAATGNVADPDPEALLAEDFYYQVYSQIRGAPRQHPHQPLGHFAQTYLFQTGARTGGHGRRHYPTADNHMQRMQQQVQRAVEAAKLKPKNKQLIFEGSLGKISFSNAKTPKPLLNIKRPESSEGVKAAKKAAHADLSPSDRKSILNNIENVYGTLMKMEDMERNMPPPPSQDDPEAIQRHMEWREKMQALNQKLWRELKVMEPIVPGSATPHPFIAFLSYAKGKKAIPRVFRHIDQEQRVTILTMIVVHLDTLDVVRRAQPQPGEAQPPVAVREDIELFSQAVMPSLLGYVNEAPFNIIIGLLGLVIAQTNVQTVAKTKVGLGILTMLLSRAEIVKEAGQADERDWQQWVEKFNILFDTLEPILGDVFPGPINMGDDMYVWQFLAAVGIGANPEQQQRLVIAVKDRVMATVAYSKTLPADMASQRLGNVNLFMRAIGLDVELLG